MKTTSFGQHILIRISKKIASAIGALKRIRPNITTRTAVQVYPALIQPHFDYCCSVWDGLGETLSCKIQKLQNRVVRVIMRANYDDSAGRYFLIPCTGTIFLYVAKSSKLV